MDDEALRLLVDALCEGVIKQDQIGGLESEMCEQMLRIFKQFKQSKVKYTVTDPMFHYEIVLRPEAIADIKRVKGWKTDAEMARALGLTRQYICNLKKRKAACTHTVITRIAAILGNTGGKWWTHFEIVPAGICNANDPLWNQDKYKGHQPYERYSSASVLRSLDYKVETTE